MRKKACIVKRGESWAVKQPLPNGRYRWQTVGTRKRDAELLRDEINRRVALGALYPTQPQTFAEFVGGWLERYAQTVRPATLASCHDSLKRLAVFDAWAVETIRAADVEDHVFSVARRAPRSAELTLKTLKMILRSAKERGQLVDEAVFRVRAPRHEPTEMRFLDWSEVERLACETVEPYGNLVRFACLTGLRQGELFASATARSASGVGASSSKEELARGSSSRQRRVRAGGGFASQSRRFALSASSYLPVCRTSSGLSSRARVGSSGTKTTSWPVSSGRPSGAPASLRSASMTFVTPTRR